MQPELGPGKGKGRCWQHDVCALRKSTCWLSLTNAFIVCHSTAHDAQKHGVSLTLRIIRSFLETLLISSSNDVASYTRWTAWLTELKDVFLLKALMDCWTVATTPAGGVPPRGATTVVLGLSLTFLLLPSSSDTRAVAP